MAKTDKHLWEIKHPYYCEETCFFSKEGRESRYDSWGEFVKSEGHLDLDLNLVFRWDWHLGEDYELPVNPDPYYRDGELLIFWMTQRKGFHRTSTVKVCKADEDSVREWLQARWEHLKLLWEPFGKTALHESGKR